MDQDYHTACPHLRASARLYQTAIESAPSGRVIIDKAGLIVLVNRETERLFSYAREELLGQLIELVPERFRAKHPKYREDFSQNASARPMGAGRDLFGRRKNGTEIPVEIGLNPVQAGEGLYVLSVIVDISERKNAEEAPLKAVEEPKRSNAEIEQFAYVASHDLEEPLRMVVGFLRLLKQRTKAGLGEKANGYIGYAVNDATRMSQLINDLLE